MDSPIIISAAQAAAQLGISVRTLDRLGTGEGRLLPIQRTGGGHRRYDAVEVEAYRLGTLPLMCDWTTGAGHTLQLSDTALVVAGARCILERGHNGGHRPGRATAAPLVAAVAQ